MTKNRLARTPIKFRCGQPLPYNCDFDMWEYKRALSSAHNSSPGPDGISPSGDSPSLVTPHRSLNFIRGVISEPDLLTTPDAEILDGFSNQGVIQFPHPQHALFLKRPPLYPIPYPLHPRVTNQTSKPRRKKRPPKNQSNTIKPKIGIQTAPYRPRKSGPTEYTTDEEDMII
ncbi:hypothetical protein TNCV_19491 [Trichonephila clavipes]|nr:hypothetical protein TNCV_19491 [Trichonephila clavipes]